MAILRATIGGKSSLLNFTSTQPTPPTPTVEYLVLQNFVSGHEIGTNETGEYLPNWIRTVISDSDCEGNWMTTWPDSPAYQYLANNTVGSNLIDTRAPIDFSGYGISSGTPFGNLTANSDAYGGILFSTGQQMTHPFTLEVWMAARFDEEETYYNASDVPIFKYGAGVGYWGNVYLTLYYVGDWEKTLKFCIHTDVDGEDTELYTMLINDGWINSWHHYALSMDDSVLYLFIDGELVFSKALSDEITIESTTKTLGEFISEIEYQVFSVNGPNPGGNGFMMDCNWAQLAFASSCKWTDDFTVPTVAY